MSSTTDPVRSQITFLYYRSLEAAASFYGEALALDLAADYGWTKIYRVSGNAFLGIVDEDVGSLEVQERNAVMISLVVDDVDRWYRRLSDADVTILADMAERHGVIRSFWCQDPGGYVLSIEQFIDPDAAGIFHHAEV